MYAEKRINHLKIITIDYNRYKVYIKIPTKMARDCDFFITSNIYTNILDKIKKDILAGVFPQCASELHKYCIVQKNPYNHTTGNLRYKLELKERIDVTNSNCVYLVLSEWIYIDDKHNNQLTRIIHISCGCRFDKSSGEYTIKQMCDYFTNNFNNDVIELHCFGDTDIESFVTMQSL